MESTLSTKPVPILSYEVSEFRTDGTRVDYRANLWHLDAKDDPIPIENANYRSFIWDSKSFFEYRRSSKDPGIVFIANNDRKKLNQVSVIYQGAPLMGIFFGDDQRVDSILQKANTISLREKTEQVSESECYVIEAVTQHGEYTVWIDPEHGYNIARAKLEKDKRDIAWNGKTINELDPINPDAPTNIRRGFGKKVGLSFSLQKVRFEKIGDIWVPMEADYEYEKTYEDGRVVIVTNHHKRTEINLNPDFTAVRAFIPDILNGAKAYIEGVTSIGYRWIDGKLVPDVDDAVIAEIDKMAEEIMAEGKVPPSLATAQKPEHAPNEPNITIDTQPKVEVNISEIPREIPAESTPSLVWAFLLAGVVIIGVIVWLVFRRRKA